MSRYLVYMIGPRRSDRVVARAPGKVNVCFRVGEERPDGSHVIATLYQAVSLFDTVFAYPSDTFSLTMLGTHHEIPGGERNLAMRAAKLLARVSNYAGAVHLEIDKQIPRGSGMSGGSADAAAALVACNELWRLGYDRYTLKKIGLDLGADVAFALGGGTAVGTGHGDEFTQALSIGTYHWVIVPSSDRLREDEVVTALTKHRDTHRNELGQGTEHPTVDAAVLHAVRSGGTRQLAEVMQNDLQMASLKLSSDALLHLEMGEADGALAGITLATTSAVALLAEDRKAAEHLHSLYGSQGIESIMAQGPVGGARVVERALRVPQAIR